MDYAFYALTSTALHNELQRALQASLEEGEGGVPGPLHESDSDLERGGIRQKMPSDSRHSNKHTLIPTGVDT